MGERARARDGTRDGHGPHVCEADGGAIVARAEQHCRERDLQFTPLRREVLQVVAGHCGPLGAYDIADRLSGRERRVAAVSVYRALDFLTEHGFVHRVASRNAFVSCGHSHGQGAGPVFLICRSCGRVGETTAPEVENELDRTLARAGFVPASRIVEVEGECRECADARLSGRA